MGWFVNHRPKAPIGRHSLSHARWACQLPQGGSLERAFPGSLSEGAVERSETEGVYPDERKSSKISEPKWAGV